MAMSSKILESILLLSFLLVGFVHSLPLSTNGKYIVDAKTGERVKLHCGNWPSHNEPMLMEGLHARPIKELVAELANTGFNCVRLTFAIWMFTRPDYGQRLVGETFDSYNLIEAKALIEKHNPWVLNMTHVEAYLAIIDEFGKQGIMVDADNHVSKPTWCCGDNDGNGFFGDTFSDPKEWLRGLTTVAKLTKNKSNVVAIGMRNEPRGPNASEDNWYKYFKKGAIKVHEANPNVLVMISGLYKSTNLKFLKEKPFGTNLDNKLVFESHWYGWDESWERPINKACPDKVKYYINQTAFVNTGDNPVPLFFGEFGLDQRGLQLASDHFLSCVLGWLTDQDVDWGLWGFQGSYYFRENKTDIDEYFGIMDYHWNRPRNPYLVDRLRLIQRKNIDPSSQQETTQILFHPQSGTCLQAEGQEVYATSCKTFSRWNYEGQGSNIWLKGSGKCLKVAGEGQPPVLSVDCKNQQSKWTTLSESNYHLAARDENGEYLCLHKESPFTNRVVTNRCILLEDDPKCHIYPQTDPTVQWFKLVDTNV